MSEHVLVYDDAPKPKFVVATLAGVVLLHVAVGYGLGQMQMNKIVLPEPKPMQVQFINLIEDKTPPTLPATPVSDVPAPTPPKPAEPKPTPRKSVPPKPIPPKPVESKPTPPKPIEPKPTPPKVAEPKPVPIKTPAPTPIQTSAPTPVPAQAPVAEQTPVTPAPVAPPATPAPPVSPAPAPVPAQAPAAPSSSSKQATTATDTGPIKLSSGQVQASWVSAPNLHFSADEAMDFNPRKKSVTVTFKFNAQGAISGVTVSGTGDRSLDREIKNRIARAKLHPQIINGTARAGTATVNLTLSGF